MRIQRARVRSHTAMRSQTVLTRKIRRRTAKEGPVAEPEPALPEKHRSPRDRRELAAPPASLCPTHYLPGIFSATLPDSPFSPISGANRRCDRTRLTFCGSSRRVREPDTRHGGLTSNAPRKSPHLRWFAAVERLPDDRFSHG